jgi:hypothetical protein
MEAIQKLPTASLISKLGTSDYEISRKSKPIIKVPIPDNRRATLAVPRWLAFGYGAEQTALIDDCVRLLHRE